MNSHQIEGFNLIWVEWAWLRLRFLSMGPLKQGTTVRSIISLILLTSFLGVHVPAQAQGPGSSASLQTIPRLDVQRYVGTWYELAKYPNRFQKQCVANTQARYSLLADGSLEVVNRCREANGKVSEAVGQARQVGGAESPQLKVRFAPAWLSFLPMVWGDYWVIDLDSEYQLAAVSEPTREYLWILSRQPKVDAVAYKNLLERLQAQGFDLRKIETLPHD